MASKVPGRQTAPSVEIWAVLMVLMVWDGTYDLTMITDASYTVQGMDDLASRKTAAVPIGISGSSSMRSLMPKREAASSLSLSEIAY